MSTPRLSGLWSTDSRMGYFQVTNDEEAGLVGGDGDEGDNRTPLDKTIDRIGMGSYQWTLLSLCGFGWLADNMWIQATAVILPRVQRHFDVSDSHIGTLSSSMFAGMMFGAIGWGTCSDLMGRTTAFNATLCLTSLFGILASFATSFVTLCLSFFFLGSAVGGSMPTDGTLLLEHMPNGKQYLVTALSVFFSFGAVLTAVVGLAVIPNHSCPPIPAPCDVDQENMGWKYLLIALGLITLVMFCARIVFFRLHESPRYLVHAGRHQEALASLQMISRFNGSDLALDLEDVQDHHNAGSSSPRNEPEPVTDDLGHGIVASDDIVFDAGDGESPSAAGRPRALNSQGSRDVLRVSAESSPPHYSSTGTPDVVLDTHSFQTPQLGHTSLNSRLFSEEPLHKEPEDDTLPEPVPRPRQNPRPRADSRISRSPSFYEVKDKVYWKLPPWIRQPLWAWADRVAMVLTPEWLRTTLLMWGIWCSMSLAYTMFNVYLPKLLEGRGIVEEGSAPKSLTDTLWDVVIYSIGGCPGAIIGAYLVDSQLGRRWSLAGSTFLTAFFCVMFVSVEQSWAVRISTIGISLSATAMWAVLYGWTPEIFGTEVRGTACGIASALSRIGGMIAPLLGGTLLMINPAFPVYASIVIFLLAGFCVMMLRDNEGERGKHQVTMH